MKKTLLKSLLLLSSFALLQGCLPEQKTSGSSGSSSNGDSVTTTEGSGGSGGGSNPVTPGSTSNFPVLTYDLVLAGHQPWLPGDYSDPLAQNTMGTISQMSAAFKSDSRLKLKFKVRSQPFPTAGEVYCYGRATGQVSDANRYQKLRFRVHLRDVLCDNVDPNDSSNCLGNFSLGNRYQTQYVDPVDVDAYSPILSLGHLRNLTEFGTVVEIDDVKSDQDCQTGNTNYCPSEKIVRAASCWHMKMEVSTDFTDDL